MSIQIFQAADLFKENMDTIPILDVRAPKEFNQGHIPQAISFPLFNDEERAEIGTLYKREGADKAYKRGLEIVGPRMYSYIEKAIEISPAKTVNVHCWRGGKRSASIAWLLDLAGFNVSVLEGGYKSFRKRVLAFEQLKNFQFIILGGRTGSAKTQLLQILRDRGEQIIDLELIAGHKGSAFGGIGEREQRNTEQFENELYTHSVTLQLNKIIWIENESKSIGKVFIPDNFWSKMKESPLIHLDIDFESRLNHLVKMYDLDDKEALKKSFDKIQKRIGLEFTNKAKELIDQNLLKEAAAIALKYYDTCYDYNLDQSSAPKIITLKYTNASTQQIAEELIQLKYTLTWKT
ncbi:MAG: tRNA 2-selenouridine(34) synthase MnmH [Bacteroidota bacterium]|nr:tRNA 2-selenouridine(34) synthase MnmH [Bacteroidota bacterium]